jgi:predicted SprT family Zn-dependent metalloprotease
MRQGSIWQKGKHWWDLAIRSNARPGRDRVGVPSPSLVVSPPFDQGPWPGHLSNWAVAWGVPGLDSRVRLIASSRMRVSLGLYYSRSREIRIADFLFDGPASLLQEVVCHEFAHAAVDERFGRAVRPHGPEWRCLMQRAGFEPRVRISGAELERLIPIARSRRVGWLHRCPNCQAERIGGRPVSNWRCVACVSSGLTGRLEIERLEPGGGRSRGASLHDDPRAAAGFKTS